MGSQEERNTHTDKRRLEKEDGERAALFDEDKRDPEMAMVERLDGRVKHAESRLTAKARDDRPPKEKGKKMLLKPMIYDYKKHNPEPVKVNKSNSADSLSLLGQVGSPRPLMSPNLSDSTNVSTRTERQPTTSPKSANSTKVIKYRTEVRSSKTDPTGISRPKRKVLRFSRPVRVQGRAEWPEITVKSVMAGFEPLRLRLAPDATVGQLKMAVKAKTRIKLFFLSFNGKELRPDDSQLRKHGVVNGSEVHVQVKSTTGHNDREELAKLMSLSKSLSDFQNLMSSIQLDEPPERSMIEHQPRESEVTLQAKRASEDRRTKERMRDIKKKIRERSAHRSPDPSLKSGAKAKLFGRPSEQGHSLETGSVWSAESVEVSAKAGGPKQDTITAKELMLFHDPAESTEVADLRQNNLMDAPDSHDAIQNLRSQFCTTRCALCFSKLPLTLCEMVCRCEKVYCKLHRHPEKHKCAVDLKEVDRRRLDLEMDKIKPAKLASTADINENNSNEPSRAKRRRSRPSTPGKGNN